MRKLSVIIASIFVFALGGCMKNTNVNAPKASADAIDSADAIADFVVKNGVKDPDCEMLEKCYKVVYDHYSGDSDECFNLELKVKEKFGKRTLEIFSYEIAISERKCEATFGFLDKKTDGVIDEVIGVIMSDDVVFLSLLYQDDTVSAGGLYTQLHTEPMTSQDIQTLYGSMLEIIVQLISTGDLK
jgi:hypothetical protein